MDGQKKIGNDERAVCEFSCAQTQHLYLLHDFARQVGKRAGCAPNGSV
jgi:hypothetical protein